ncbi:MAG: inorganic phosphate transporter, partial [Clostridia bacterium]|nr:inorganic phosphate transporter [Clostridia bacterium]
MQFSDLFATPLSAAVAVAALGVLFVNGWTDAPNAIASAVATNALSMRQGVLLAGVMNALGGLSALLIGQKVAQTVY